MTTTFQDEEGDIVKLVASEPDLIRRGWVNVGPHSICIEFDPDTGALTVEAHPRCNEGINPLCTLKVSREEVEAAGGIDPDRADDDEEGDDPPAVQDR